MIRINLAPQVDQTGSRNVILRDFLIVLGFCVLAYYGTQEYAKTFDHKIEQLDADISELTRQKSSMQKDIEKATEIRKRSEQIKSRTTRIRQLSEGRKTAIILMDSLQSKHPERMWFSEIKYSASTNTLKLTGFALDHTVIADYMKRLKEIGNIDPADREDLKNFIPPQLVQMKTGATPKLEKQPIQTLEDITLTDLVSTDDVGGVTLQKFEINIKLRNG